MNEADDMRHINDFVDTLKHVVVTAIDGTHKAMDAAAASQRKPCEGMMLHQDGSRHRWLQGEAPLDLIVTMDDATSTIYSAFLVEEEGTVSTLRGLLEVFVAHGLPCALYSDRGSHYFYTDKAGEAVDKGRRTQVGRALDRLGIEHIPAYSPEARGRSERMLSHRVLSPGTEGTNGVRRSTTHGADHLPIAPNIR